MLEELQAWSVPEVVAVVLAVAYLLLAIRQNIWCWLCAALSTAIYIWLFAAARLYMESLLNAFYFAMAIYGWRVWRSGLDESHRRPIVVWPRRVHVIALLLIGLSATSCGYVLYRFTDAAYPFVDATTTFAAIWATFLVTRKVLENWWYWLAIDAASIFIYWSRDLQLTSLLFVFYVLLIPVGLAAWRRSYRERLQPVLP